MNHHSITNLKDPTFGKEAATKDYADEKLSKAGGRMTGYINMGTHEITNLAEPTGNSNAAGVTRIWCFKKFLICSLRVLWNASNRIGTLRANNCVASVIYTPNWHFTIPF